MRRCILPYPDHGARGNGGLAPSPWRGRGRLAWEGRFGRDNERARHVVSPFQGFFSDLDGHGSQGGALRLTPLRSALGWYVGPLRGVNSARRYRGDPIADIFVNRLFGDLPRNVRNLQEGADHLWPSVEREPISYYLSMAALPFKLEPPAMRPASRSAKPSARRP